MKRFLALLCACFALLNAAELKSTQNEKNMQSLKTAPNLNSTPNLNPAPQEMSIIKGKALVLEFDKKGLKEVLFEGKKQGFFTHPKKSDKIIVILTNNYKRPLKQGFLRLVYTNGVSEILIKGAQGSYPKERLKVAQNKVKPPKEVQERIQKELKEANAVYSTYTNEPLFNGAFILPINSKITSEFGSARVYNDGALASFHGGTDFRAAIGTPVMAANDGVVRLAKERYYAGGSVIIDHGYKIFTQYYHLDKILVKNGQMVKKGDIIALSGASGRVTGAHLHFGVFVSGAQIDPLDFIAQFNKFF